MVWVHVFTAIELLNLSEMAAPSVKRLNIHPQELCADRNLSDG